MSYVEKALQRVNELIKKCDEESEEYTDYVVMKQALEKQVSKAPKISYGNEFTDADGNNGMKLRYVECPNCECEILAHFDYCPECGQRLSWEVEVEE